MADKIQLSHPAGKHAVRMDADKYDLLKEAILHALPGKKELKHQELLDEVVAYFKKNNIQFEGSVGWYMESVKLDLEANNVVERVKDKDGLRFKLKN